MNEKRETAVAVKSDVVEEVSKQIEVLQKKGKLTLAPNYAVQNALMSAWLILQETVDKNKNPVLESCTRPSIVNSLLDMVIQGLSPQKKQCYFIAYLNHLSCFRSYFGSMAVVKNLAGAEDVRPEIIYAGDVFTYDIQNGNATNIKHSRNFANINDQNIAGAYCTITFKGDKESFTEIMNMDQIKKAWKKSRMDPEREGSTHKEFTSEMCKRTVINRACKRHINSSSDDALLLAAFNRADEISTEEKVSEEIKEKGNREVIDIEKVPAEKETKKEEDQSTGTEEKAKKKEEDQPTKEEAEMKEEKTEGKVETSEEPRKRKEGQQTGEDPGPGF